MKTAIELIELQASTGTTAVKTTRHFRAVLGKELCADSAPAF